MGQVEIGGQRACCFSFVFFSIIAWSGRDQVYADSDKGSTDMSPAHGMKQPNPVATQAFRALSKICFALNSSSNCSGSSTFLSFVLCGLRPSSACKSHIRSCRLAHLSLLFSICSPDGRHLLFKIRRIASGETLKCSASTGVDHLSESCSCSVRMPSMASGDSFFRGFQPSSPNFSFRASFCSCHCSRFCLGRTARSLSSRRFCFPFLLCWPDAETSHGRPSLSR